MLGWVQSGHKNIELIRKRTRAAPAIPAPSLSITRARPSRVTQSSGQLLVRWLTLLKLSNLTNFTFLCVLRNFVFLRK